MNEALSGKDFKMHVQLEGGIKRRQIPVEIADMVSGAFIQIGQTTSGHVREAVDLAQDFLELMKKSQLTAMTFSINTPESGLSDRQTMVALQPHVEQIRSEYFGSTRVPFPTYGKAVGWLRREEDGTDDVSSERWGQSCDDLQRVTQIFAKTTSYLEWGITPRFIPLLKRRPGELNPRVMVGREGVLYKLWKFTHKMADVTGYDSAQCVAHVLVGTPLLLRPITYFIEDKPGFGLHYHSATIQILAPHVVTFDMLKKIFGEIRQRMGLSKKKTAAGRHLRLIQLIDKIGGVPRSNKTAFWKDIQRQWNKAIPTGGRRYTTWMGPKMAYDRIQAKHKRSRHSQMGGGHGREARKVNSLEKKYLALSLERWRRLIKEERENNMNTKILSDPKSEQ